MAHEFLTVDHLTHVYHAGSRKALRAVDDLSFHINQGETLGLVGESGCGKTTTGKIILGLEKPTSGDVRLQGHSILNLKTAKEKAAYRKSIQIIFQDPYSSMDPKMTIEQIVGESLDVFHMVKSRQEKRERVGTLLEMVGLQRSHMDRYPHEFSGGQRQRICIARALSMSPKLVVCDEPISSLDVSIQAQIVNLLQDLQAEQGLSYLFIAHDLSMVKYISHRIGVMYQGRLVELGPSEELYHHPIHPYTRSLLSMIPVPEPLVERGRSRNKYTPAAASAGPLSLRELAPEHYVLCDEEGRF